MCCAEASHCSLFHISNSRWFPLTVSRLINDETDLNDLVIHHPSKTFCAWENRAGRNQLGDTLVVDRTDVLWISRCGCAQRRVTVKRIYQKDGTLSLVSENGACAWLSEMDFEAGRSDLCHTTGSMRGCGLL